MEPSCITPKRPALTRRICIAHVHHRYASAVAVEALPRPGAEHTTARHREAARRPHARAADCGERVRYSVVVVRRAVLRFAVVRFAVVRFAVVRFAVVGALFGCSSIVLQLERSADRRPATVAGSVVTRHPAGGSTRRRSMVLMSGGPFRAGDTVEAPLKGATCHPT
jgi:hypothetical protein